MNNKKNMSIKKMFSGKFYVSVAAFLLICSVFVGVARPASAQSVTVQQLQAEIAALQVQLAQLLAQIQGTTVSTVPAVCSGIAFTRNLSLGMTGNDVRCLQAILNQSSNTRLALTGYGSPGNETIYFGPLTQAAVIRFQIKYASSAYPAGLDSDTGAVGQQTRAQLNMLLVPATTGGGTGGTTGGGTTGIPGVPAGFVINGRAGDFTTTLYPVPANGVKVYAGDVNDKVMGIQIRALGSDIAVQRVALNFDTLPYNYFTNVYLYDGGTVIASLPVNSTTVSRITGSDYQISLQNFQNPFIVSNGTTKILTVAVDMVTGISASLLPFGSSTNVTMNVETNGIRAIDQSNASLFDPPDSTTISRVINVNGSLSSNASMVINLDSGTPLTGNISADVNGNITGATIMKFDATATNGDLIIDEIDNVSFTTGNNYLVPQTVYLYDSNNNVLGTASPNQSTGMASFTNMNISISRNASPSFTIRIDDTLASNGSDNGKIYRVTVSAKNGNTAYLIVQRPDGTLLPASQVNGSAQSYPQYAYLSGSIFSVTGITTTSNPRTQVTAPTISATYTINVTAANGTIYIPRAGAFEINAVPNAVLPGTPATSIVYNQPQGTLALSNSYQVPQGTTVTFVVTATYVLSGSPASYYLSLVSANWGTSDVSPSSSSTSFVGNNYVSNIVFLQ